MRRYIYIITIVVLLLVINGLAHSIYDIWNKRDIVSDANRQLSQEKLKNQKLKAELSYVQTKGFVEEEARNKLFLSKPDEKVIIVPQASQSAGEKREVQIVNWQKWWKLFF